MRVGLLSIGVFCALSALAAFVLHVYATPGRVRPQVRVWACAALFTVGLVSYGLAGDVFGGDAPSHTARTWLFGDILSNGEIPIWTNRWYLGFPIGFYYGFLYYLGTGTVVALSGLGVSVVTQTTLLVLHAAAGGAFFRLARTLDVGVAAALFGALFYTYSFQHLGPILHAGALPLSVVFVVLPALLLVSDRVVLHPARSLTREVFQAAALVAVLLFTHLQYAFYVIGGVGLVCLVRIGASAGRRDAATIRRLVTFLAGTALVVLVVAGWFIVPAALEREYVVMASDRLKANLLQQATWPDVLRAVRRLTIVSRDEDWLHFYLGLVPIATIGLALATMCRKPRRMSLVQAGYVWALVATLPLALMSRFMTVWFVLAAVVSVWGADAFQRHVAARRPASHTTMAGLAAIVLLLAECSLTLVHRNYRTLPDLAHVTQAHGRLVVAERSEMALWRSLDVVVTGRSSILGGIPQSAPPSYPHMVAIEAALVAEMLDPTSGGLTPETRDALRMVNVGTIATPGEGPVTVIDDATPAIFSVEPAIGSASMMSIERESWVDLERQFRERSFDRRPADAAIQAMELVPGSAVARRIVMHPSIGADELRALVPSDRSGEPVFVVRGIDERHTRATLDYRASSGGLVQLAYSYYPFLTVRIDGTPVPTYPSAFGLLVVPVPAGDHSIVVEAGVSPLTRRWLLIAVVGILAGSLWVVARAAFLPGVPRGAE